METLINKNQQKFKIIHVRNIEEEAQIKNVRILQKSQMKQIGFVILSILSFGIFYLICRWFQKINKVFLYIECEDKDKQEVFVEVKNMEEQIEIVQGEWRKVVIDERERVDLCFQYRLYNYMIDRDIDLIKGIESEIGYVEKEVLLSKYANGVKEEEVEGLRGTFGKNETKMAQKEWGQILIEEVLSPFSIFQVFSCVLWFFEGYTVYAVVIVVTCFVSSVITVVSSLDQQKRLQKMSSGVEEVKVIREGKEMRVGSDELVVGDKVMIEQQTLITCDLILLEGECVVNECLLTGESTPVVKEGIVYSPCSPPYKNQILLAGTFCVQTRKQGQERVTAIVVNIGYSTLKGCLVRSLIFPKKVSFQFYRDCLRFIACLFVLGVVGFGMSLYLMVEQKVSPSDIALRTLDLITICVPPALPTCMTIGTIFALNVLKLQGVFCTSPSRLNIAARINLMCFDKTGTLTDDSLDTHGVVSREDITRLIVPEEIPFMKGQSQKMLLHAMATCHSLSMVGGQLVGDPLEIKMVQSTGSVLEECSRYDDQLMLSVSQLGGSSLGVMRRLPFDNVLQRMSVVMRCLEEKEFQVMVKGSAEMIVGLCQVDSVPKGLDETLDNLTRQGYRVLAIAHRPIHLSYLDLHKANRHSLESSLVFLGLLVMANPLKADTSNVISQLEAASITSIMVTGDDLLTAISVAIDCNILPCQPPLYISSKDPSLFSPYSDTSPPLSSSLLPSHSLLAITGPVFRSLTPPQTNIVLSSCRVYARMNPNDKQSLVNLLQQAHHNNIVGMCGDGANDCAALKQAHVGISLSKAEASIAAPFTSQQQDITCVIQLLREARCSLTTAFQCFKFMALYSIIQFSGVTLLYSVNSSFSVYQFVYVDLIIVFPLATFLSYTRSSSTLASHKPPSTLMSLPVLFSVFSLIAIQILFQLFAYLLLTNHYPLYQKCIDYVKNPTEISDYLYCQENTVLFNFSNIQYIAVAVAFSIGSPFKKPIYTNYYLIILLILQIILNVLILFKPGKFLFLLLKLVDIEDSFKIKIIFLTLANVICTLFFELVVVKLTTKILEKYKKKR